MTDPRATRIEITYQDVQRAGKDILDYAETPDEGMDPLDTFVARIAVRLAFAARSMKPSAEPPASVIVRTYCDEVGVDYQKLDAEITRIAGEHRVKALMAQMEDA